MFGWFTSAPALPDIFSEKVTEANFKEMSSFQDFALLHNDNFTFSDTKQIMTACVSNAQYITECFYLGARGRNKSIRCFYICSCDIIIVHLL